MRSANRNAPSAKPWLSFVVVGGGADRRGDGRHAGRDRLSHATQRIPQPQISTACASVLVEGFGPHSRRLRRPSFRTRPSGSSRNSASSCARKARSATSTRKASRSARTASASVAKTVIWGAGVVAASPLGRQLGVPLDQAPSRVIVGRDLSIPDHPEVYVIGDLASYNRPRRQARARRQHPLPSRWGAAPRAISCCA